MTPRIYRSLTGIGPEARPSAVTIGNFDGVHEGHRAIFRRVVAAGRENGWKPSVLTFDPHPTRVVAPDRAPKLLSTSDERFALMGHEGIEQIFVIPFDRPFSQLGPEEFVGSVLVDMIGAKAVLVGENFRFGKRQAGDVKMLAELGRRYGFTTEIVPGVRMRGLMVSSSEVRRLILAGRVGIACRLLGRPYALEGRVTPGHGVGSKQTVPTLNLATEAEVLPASGVYITRTDELGGGARKWPSITNVGFRPTFDGNELTIETYLLEPVGGDSPDRIRVQLLRRVREERKFDSPEALKTQILRDVARAQAYHRRAARLTISPALY